MKFDAKGQHQSIPYARSGIENGAARPGKERPWCSCTRFPRRARAILIISCLFLRGKEGGRLKWGIPLNVRFAQSSCLGAISPPFSRSQPPPVSSKQPTQQRLGDTLPLLISLFFEENPGPGWKFAPTCTMLGQQPIGGSSLVIRR